MVHITSFLSKEINTFLSAYGCMERIGIGIMPPHITITADDKHLKAGKPEPYSLSNVLGFSAKHCVMFVQQSYPRCRWSDDVVIVAYLSWTHSGMSVLQWSNDVAIQSSQRILRRCGTQIPQ